MNGDHPAMRIHALMDELNAPPPPDPPPVREPRPVAVPLPPAGIDWAAVLRGLAPVLVLVGVVVLAYLLYLISH